jgi:glutamyl-tRNA synthetase
MTVRVRIAPSPTGDPHVGTAYIALFNYCFARKNGGQFILRIEDTDRTRSTQESEEAILRALRWVGLSWDEGPDIGGEHGPYRQSERADIYREHAELLLARGRAYRCFCTAERLAALRESRRRRSEPRLRRPVPRLRLEESRARAAAGESHVVRLAMPREAQDAVQDLLRGAIEYENAADRRPGAAQVGRLPDLPPGQRGRRSPDGDHPRHPRRGVADRRRPSTSSLRRLRLAGARWVHMPLLRNADKSKISKRKNPVSLDYYRDAGILPEALLNFLGLMGWSLGGDREKFTLAEMVDGFDFDRISLGGPVFDLEKLSWLNGTYLREMPPHEVVRRLRGWLLSDDHLMRVVPLVRERIRRFDEFIPATEFFFSGDLDYTPVAKELVPKGRSPARRGGVARRARRGVRGAARRFAAQLLEPLDARLRREARLEDQGAFHDPARGDHRPHRVAAPLRDHGGAGARDRAPSHPPGGRVPEQAKVTVTAPASSRPIASRVRWFLNLWREIHEDEPRAGPRAEAGFPPAPGDAAPSRCRCRCRSSSATGGRSSD